MYRMGSPKTGKSKYTTLIFLLTINRIRRIQDRWVLVKKKLPQKPIELSITNTKSTKTVIEMRASPETNDFDLEECIEWVSCKSVCSEHRTRNLAQ